MVELKKPKLKDGKEQLKSYCNATGAPKRINEQLKNTIKPLCPVLMKGVFENMKLETV